MNEHIATVDNRSATPQKIHNVMVFTDVSCQGALDSIITQEMGVPTGKIDGSPITDHLRNW